MSGHSKWSQIRRQKGAADIKRGQVFTKLGNAITIAAREGGGEPASNFKLRLVIDQARAANMPKENIQRAIDRGLGKGAGGVGQLELVTYEGYGPGRVALIVEATTDNKNRTTAEVKKIIEFSGGNFVSPGTLAWMFTDEGIIAIAKDGKTFDEIFDLAAEVGAEDVEESGDLVNIYTKPSQLDVVKKALIDRGLSPQSAEIAKRASTTVEIKDPEVAKKILDLMEKLEDHDDVQKVWSNFDIPANLLSGIQGSRK